MGWGRSDTEVLLSAPAALLLAEASLRWQQHPTPTFDNSEEHALFRHPPTLPLWRCTSYSVLLRKKSAIATLPVRRITSPSLAILPMGGIAASAIEEPYCCCYCS